MFRELRCSAKVEASVRGVRATHDIDVWVVFERFGLKQKWAVECKFWDKPIPKEKVLALRSIVEDVGADKGILVAESGFQPGAFSAATSTNILLTTLADLRILAEDDLQEIILQSLEKKAISLRERHYNLYEWYELGPGSAAASPRPGVDSEKYIGMSALLGALDEGFKRVKMDQFPAPIGIDFEVDSYKMARSRNEFVELVGETIENVDGWISRQEAAIKLAMQKGRGHS